MSLHILDRGYAPDYKNETRLHVAHKLFTALHEIFVAPKSEPKTVLQLVKISNKIQYAVRSCQIDFATPRCHDFKLYFAFKQVYT